MGSVMLSASARGQAWLHPNGEIINCYEEAAPGLYYYWEHVRHKYRDKYHLCFAPLEYFLALRFRDKITSTQ